MKNCIQNIKSPLTKYDILFSQVIRNVKLAYKSFWLWIYNVSWNNKIIYRHSENHPKDKEKENRIHISHGQLCDKIGYQNGMIIGCLICIHLYTQESDSFLFSQLKMLVKYINTFHTSFAQRICCTPDLHHPSQGEVLHTLVT